MNPAHLEHLCEQLTRLRLLKSRERLDALLQEAAAKDLSYADFLSTRCWAKKSPPGPKRTSPCAPVSPAFRL